MVAGVLIAIALVLDQLQEDTLMEGQMVVAGAALGFLAMVLVSGPGFRLSRGKLRYRSSGRQLADERVKCLGSVDRGSAVHAALTTAGITRREIEEWSLTRRSDASTKGSLCVSVY